MVRNSLIIAFALVSTQAFALDKCWYEKHHTVGGDRDVYIHIGANPKPEKIEKFSNLIKYLEDMDGKACDADWASAEAYLDYLYDDLGKDFQRDQAAAHTRYKKKAADARAAAKASSEGSSCEAKLAIAQQRIETLDSSIYNSVEKRTKFIQDLNAAIGDAAKGGKAN